MSEIYERAATYYSEQLLPLLKPSLTGRLLASVNSEFKGDGKTNYNATKLVDTLSAFIQFKRPDGTEHKDSVGLTDATYPVPVVYSEFMVEMEAILASEHLPSVAGNNGLENIHMRASAYAVSAKENEMIYKGFKPNGSSVKIPGFLAVADTLVTGGTITNPGVFRGFVSEAIAKLREANVIGDNNAYNVVVSSDVYSAIENNVRTGSQKYELEEVETLLKGGQVIIASEMKGEGGSSTTDAALVTPVDINRRFFEFLNPVTPTYEFAEPKWKRLSPVEGICYEYFRPYFKYETAGKADKTVAVAKITGLKTSA